MDNGKAFYAQWWKRTQSDGETVAGVARGQIYPTRDNVFVNNVVVTTLRKSAVLQAEGNVEPSSKRVTRSDYNAYYFAGAGAQTAFARWAKDGGEPANYASLGRFSRHRASLRNARDGIGAKPVGIGGFGIAPRFEKVERAPTARRGCTAALGR